MKIQVDRKHSEEGNLVFTITVSDGKKVPFKEDELICLTSIDAFTKTLAQTLDPASVLYQDILSANHKVKEKVFLKVLDNLKFSIENDFRPKFRPICQEIYNWIYDQQTGVVKSWMNDFDPQRTTYYFDNDKKGDVYSKPQVSEHDDEDDDFEDDEDDN